MWLPVFTEIDRIQESQMARKTFFLTAAGQAPKRLYIDIETNNHVFLTIDPPLVENTPREEFDYSTPEPDELTQEFPSPEIQIKRPRLRSPPPPPRDDDGEDDEIAEAFQRPIIASPDLPSPTTIQESSPFGRIIPEFVGSSPEPVMSPMPRRTQPPRAAKPPRAPKKKRGKRVPVISDDEEEEFNPSMLRLRGPKKPATGKSCPNGRWLNKRTRTVTKQVSSNGDTKEFEEEIDEVDFIGTDFCDICYQYSFGGVKYCHNSRCHFGICKDCNVRWTASKCPKCSL